ncbi:MAG: PadR family transcriptional regulator [Candidatus Bathyarchaeia archaeon]
MSETFKKEIVQRITRNFLDITILKLVHAKPMWGYKIKKQIETLYNVKVRHGALYPLLNTLEANGFLSSKYQTEKGRKRKIYEITGKGIQYLEAYNNFLKEQMQN